MFVIAISIFLLVNPLQRTICVCCHEKIKPADKTWVCPDCKKKVEDSSKEIQE